MPEWNKEFNPQYDGKPLTEQERTALLEAGADLLVESMAITTIGRKGLLYERKVDE